MSTPRVITFKAGYWHHEVEDDKTVIHIGGKTAKNETVYVKVLNFEYIVYLELPTRISWTPTTCKILYNYFKSTLLKDRDKYSDNKDKFMPIKYDMEQKYFLHYKKPVDCLKMYFPSDKAAIQLGYRMNDKKGFYIPDLGKFNCGEFKVHEQNIDPVIKFGATSNVKLSNWIKVKEFILEGGDEGEDPEDRKFSSADIDLYADYKDVKIESPDKKPFLQVRYCSFDIECYSKNHNSKMPDPKIPENKVIQIGMTFGVLGAPPESRHKIILSLGYPRKIENVDELRVYTSEEDLLLDFTKIIMEYDPDTFIGYNIIKFDWNYMIIRASEILGIYEDFCKMSRIFGKSADLKTMKWGSSAYGEQDFSYLECHGRTNMDVLVEIERNVKLPKYSLDYVSEYYLKKHKDDVSARGLFMLWQFTEEIASFVIDKVPTLKELTLFHKQIEKIFSLRQCHGIVKTYRSKLLSCTRHEFGSVACEAMEIVGKYCIQDTMLPIDLAEKLNSYTTMEEMSNVTNVPASYLSTRGQQIRVVAQLYRETLKEKIIIPYAKQPDVIEKFQGALVVEAHPGEYYIVPTLDFSSLYPSIIIAFNICYTTIIEDNDKICPHSLKTDRCKDCGGTPDEEAHIIAWNEHCGCLCDPQKRKVHKDKILCKDHYYRFKRVTFVPDGKGGFIRMNEGLLPRLERNLLAERKIYKKEMFKVEARIKTNAGLATDEELSYYKKVGFDILEKGSVGEKEAKMMEVVFGILNAKQLSVKVSANSIYGIMGAQKGYIPFVIGGASVTAMGRKLITMAVERIKKEYDYVELIYGDSVSHDTPILCRLGEDIFYRTIDNLPVKNCTLGWDGEKEYFIPLKGLEVWTDKGFTELKQVIRHKTTKKMYRVLTNTGSVDVTEDHSLLNEKAEKVKPGDVKVGDTLLHSDLPTIDVSESDKSLFHNSGNNLCQSKIESAELYLLASSLGYNMVVDIENNVSINPNATLFNEDSNKIKRIIELPCIGNEYVYDLETENHHFAAGVGRMVVHNTDSCMIHFKGKTIQESWALAGQASRMVSHYLKCYILGIEENHSFFVDGNSIPINKIKSIDDNFKKLSVKDQYLVLSYESNPVELDFENMYRWFLLLTKKRYMATKCNEKGEDTGNVNKGVCLTRRDNCRYLRDTYNLVKKEGLLEYDAMNIINDRVHQLFTLDRNNIPVTHLIIYMGIKSLLNYAVSIKVKNGRTVTKVPIDKNKNVIEDVLGPLDPRLVYRNTPQVLLAKKMMERGEVVPANTRLEYLYLYNPEAKHQGEKAEDYTYYYENKDIPNADGELLKPDYLHYLEKQLKKPMQELLKVRYPKKVRPCISLEDKLRDELTAMDHLHRVRVANIVSFGKNYTDNSTRYIPNGKDKICIGWSVLQIECSKKVYNRVKCQDRLSEDRKMGYYYKNNDARISYIIDDIKYGKGPLSMSKKDYPTLLNLCHYWKSMNILNKLYKQYKITCRKWLCPSEDKSKLRVKSKVIMVKDFGKILAGTICKIIDREDEESKKLSVNGKRFLKHVDYFYDLLDGETIERRVDRKYFTTFTTPGEEVMDNIYNYRYDFAEVINEINTLSKQIKDEAIIFASCESEYEG